MGNDFFGNIISAGLGAATGNPLAIGAGVLGLGMSIFGGVKQSEAEKERFQAQRQITGLEQKQEAVRREAMRLSARRQQMEVLRNAQRARSLALNNATSQGAQFGSGLQGGYGQIQGAAQWNIAGIKQNLSFGEQMFDLNSLISQQKLNISQAEEKSSTAQGISKIGGSLMNSFGPIRNLSSTFLGPGNTKYAGNNSIDYTSYRI